MQLAGTGVRGVLLDVDGTLLDSNDAHAESWVAIFRRHGAHIPFERVRPLIGKGGDKLLPELTGVDAESPRGARSFVQALKARGARIVIATSSNEKELGPLLEQAQVADLIERATSSDDGASKPDPDIIRAALAEGGLAPEEALMVGDTPYDIEAAARSGVKTIALRCGGWWTDAALAGAAAIYDDPAALAAAIA